MMFLVGPDLSKAIDGVLGEESCQCAVAFWGQGSAKKIKKNKSESKIICNLRTGGTNPYEIEELMRKATVRQCDKLHAKVYIGKKIFITASANASANGLGFEGGEQASWIEAGVRLKTNPEIVKWFDIQWMRSREISPVDLEKAKVAWRHRQKSKLPLFSFADFDTDQRELPLLYWWGDGDWELNVKAVEAEMGDVSKKTRDAINAAPECVEGDREVMGPGKWLVQFEAGKAGRIKKPSWYFTGRLVENAFKYKGEKKYRDCVIKGDNPPQPPFDFKEKGVRKAFVKTISEEGFAGLREGKSGRKFYTKEVLDLNRMFWVKCKERYKAGNPD